jgi:hypothetical protein
MEYSLPIRMLLSGDVTERDAVIVLIMSRHRVQLHFFIQDYAVWQPHLPISLVSENAKPVSRESILWSLLPELYLVSLSLSLFSHFLPLPSYTTSKSRAFQLVIWKPARVKATEFPSTSRQC